MNNDLISRSKLKKAICELAIPIYEKMVLKAIDNAPTVSPKQGEWIKEPNGKTTDIYRCSICGRSILLCKDADLSKYPFCHCGAKMRKGGAE